MDDETRDTRTLTLARPEALQALEVVVWRAVLRAIHEQEVTLETLTVPRHRLPADIVELWNAPRQPPAESAGELVHRLAGELDALDGLASAVHLGHPAGGPGPGWIDDGATIRVERGTVFALQIARGLASTVLSLRVRNAPASPGAAPSLQIATEPAEGIDAWAMDELGSIVDRLAACRR